MIGKKTVVLNGQEIDLDFNLIAYEQLCNLLAEYADMGLNIDLSQDTFDKLFYEVQTTSFLLAVRMVIYAGHRGERLDKGKRPKYSYKDIKDMVEKSDENELGEILKFYWATLYHEQEGEKETEKKVHTETSKKKVSITKKSKQSV